ncbi:MAG: hypothetical protein Rubg2KO_32320 [Rubricoccaceae bacterium]
MGSKDKRAALPSNGAERQRRTCPACRQAEEDLERANPYRRVLSVGTVQNVVDADRSLAVQEHGGGEASEAESGHQAESSW